MGKSGGFWGFCDRDHFFIKMGPFRSSEFLMTDDFLIMTFEAKVTIF